MSSGPVQFGAWRGIHTEPETQVGDQGWGHLCGVGMKEVGRLTEEVSIVRYDQTEGRRTESQKLAGKSWA